MAVFRQRLKATFGWGEDVIGTMPLVVGSIADLDPRALHGVRDFPGYDVIVTNPPYLTPRNWHPDPARRARMLESWRQTTPERVLARLPTIACRGSRLIRITDGSGSAPCEIRRGPPP